MTPIAPLFEGSIDIVGDIHREIDALGELLGNLGYTKEGKHPRGRRLVFVGDLCDRGPDSPAVVGLVSSLVDRELAQCILGNHELNLLRQARKEGNGWYFSDNHDQEEDKFLDSEALSGADREAVESFLLKLPLVLEREDLRVVHAVWHQPAIDTIRSSGLSALELDDQYESQIRQQASASGMSARAEAELALYAIKLNDGNARIPLLENAAALDELIQNGNPIRIITSGIERVAREPFFVSGKWRMVDRVAWWDEYTDPTAVIFGHYWRWPTRSVRDSHSRGERDLFAPAESHHLLGPKRNTFCVDFAVGARYKERAGGTRDTFECRLAAVRWPDKEIVFDHGARRELI